VPEATARNWRVDPLELEPSAPHADRPRPRLVEAPPPAPPVRRTVTIRGQVAPPRRRPAPRPHERVGPRPDRIALWAVVMGIFLILVAATSSHASPRAHTAAYSHGTLGSRTLQQGMSGEDVRMLQRLLGIDVDGIFGSGTAHAVRVFQHRAGLTADGRVGPATRLALIHHRMRTRTASYFGPGLWGHRTACGQVLTHRLRGVAHRSLPCGTIVTLEYGGRFASARVVDRGPYVRGRSLDLTYATARSIGFSGTGSLRVR
jgi:rare lipoprotein A (peptidoglycan hydrolase)